MKYDVPYIDDDEKNLIRRWAGRTSGASILRRSDDWTMEEHNGCLVWSYSYIVEVKHKKAEMLLKLQFPKAIEHKKYGLLEEGENWWTTYNVKSRP